MNTKLTPGRWRGLKATSTSEHVFTIMAFDQRGSYAKMLPPDSSYEHAVAIKSEVVGQLSPYTSAVLLDADYGLLPAMQMHRNSGLLMALEKSGYTGDSTMRRADFDPDWTVAKMRKAGAAAVKLLIYYHPDSGALAEEIEGAISDILQDCHVQDLPLFVEPMSYSLDPDVATDSEEFAETKPAVVIETAKRISALGVDILKLEFPMNAKYHGEETEWLKACETVSEVSTVSLGAAQRWCGLRGLRAPGARGLSGRSQWLPWRTRHLEGMRRHVSRRALRIPARHGHGARGLPQRSHAEAWAAVDRFL